MNSNRKAEAILGELLEQLSPERIHHLIDQPIQNALEEFLQDLPQPRTTQQFNTTIAKFVQITHAECPPPSSLTVQEAYARAQQYLTRNGTGEANGYDLAILETVHDQTGTIKTIINTLAQAILEERRTNYQRWTTARTLAPLNWQTKTQLTHTILQHLAPTLPATAATLTTLLPQLLNHYTTTIHTAQKIVQKRLQKPNG